LLIVHCLALIEAESLVQVVAVFLEDQTNVKNRNHLGYFSQLFRQHFARAPYLFQIYF
jgi:hypothetical protein